jgi:hypothetical protein
MLLLPLLLLLLETLGKNFAVFCALLQLVGTLRLAATSLSRPQLFPWRCRCRRRRCRRRRC